MPQDLTPRVVESRDEEYFERDSGKLRRVTVVTYRLGELGPFREEFEREMFTEYELQQRMDKKAATLRRFT